MITEFRRCMAFICPQCGHNTISQVTPFTFSGKHIITAMCRFSSCRQACVQICDHGQVYHIGIVCPLCGGIHGAEVPKSAMWSSEFLKFTCDADGSEIFFIGSDNRIVDAAIKAEEKLAAGQEEYYDYFEDFKSAKGDELLSNLITLIIESLYFFKENGVLRCKCGCSDVSVTVIDDRIGLRCKKCRSKKIIKPSEKYLAELCELDEYIFN